MNLNIEFTALRKFAIGLIFATLVLVFSVVFAFRNAIELNESYDWVHHTYDVKDKLDRIVGDLTMNESSVRGYVITGDKQFLSSFEASNHDIFSNLDSLKKLVRDNENQQLKIPEFQLLIEKRINLLEEYITHKQKHDRDSVLFLAMTSEGKKQMDEIRKLKIQMSAEENMLLDGRRDLADHHLNTAIITLTVSGVGALTIMILVLFSVRRDIREREALENSLRALDVNKNKFFSIISHDLRGPVQSIGRLTSFLESEKTTKEETIEIAQAIRQTTEQVGNLLDNLLLWSKHQMGRTQFIPVKFPIRKLVDSSISLLTNSARSKRIVVENRVEELTTFADKNMIDLVIRNLIQNAIKFTETGGKITISSSLTDEHKMEIRIKDTGVGIPDAVLKTIFQVQHAHSRMGTDEEKGTGLGLILCKEFVEKNGGSIGVESNEGNGSEFYFTIPTAG
ncbi:MAG: CHASE3 domain-containing protein [Cytophagaceae bacterium]